MRQTATTLDDEPFGSCVAHRAVLWQSVQQEDEQEDYVVDVVCGHGCLVLSFPLLAAH